MRAFRLVVAVVAVQILIVAEYIGRYHKTVREAHVSIKDPKGDLRDLVKRAESVLKSTPPSGRRYVRRRLCVSQHY